MCIILVTAANLTLSNFRHYRSLASGYTTQQSKFKAWSIHMEVVMINDGAVFNRKDPYHSKMQLTFSRIVWVWLRMKSLCVQR